MSRDLAREVDEALMLTEGASTLKDMAAGYVDGVMWKARALSAESTLSAQQDLIRRMVEGLKWTAEFAEMRAADDSKTFAKVNRGALRTIDELARSLLVEARAVVGEKE